MPRSSMPSVTPVIVPRRMSSDLPTKSTRLLSRACTVACTLPPVKSPPSARTPMRVGHVRIVMVSPMLSNMNYRVLGGSSHYCSMSETLPQTHASTCVRARDQRRIIANQILIGRIFQRRESRVTSFMHHHTIPPRGSGSRHSPTILVNVQG